MSARTASVECCDGGWLEGQLPGAAVRSCLQQHAACMVVYCSLGCYGLIVAWEAVGWYVLLQVRIGTSRTQVLIGKVRWVTVVTMVFFFDFLREDGGCHGV